jgi:hypothetical protein
MMACLKATARTRYLFSRVLCSLLLIVTATLTSPAFGDVRYKPHGAYVWEAFARDKKKPSDPLQFIFMDRHYAGNPPPNSSDLVPGREGSCLNPDHYYRCRVQILYERLWDRSAVPKKYPSVGNWYNHDKTNGPNANLIGTDRLCAKHHLTVLFSGPPLNDAIDIKAANNGGTGSTSPACDVSQYHARFWNDAAHAQQQPSHRLGEWLLGGFHHDSPPLRFKPDIPPVEFGHKIDLDWDQAEHANRSAMHRVCQQPGWGVYPNVMHMYQHKHWSGRIDRFTTTRTADGCKNA